MGNRPCAYCILAEKYLDCAIFIYLCSIHEYSTPSEQSIYLPRQVMFLEISVSSFTTIFSSKNLMDSCLLESLNFFLAIACLLNRNWGLLKETLEKCPSSAVAEKIYNLLFKDFSSLKGTQQILSDGLNGQKLFQNIDLTQPESDCSIIGRGHICYNFLMILEEVLYSNYSLSSHASVKNFRPSDSNIEVQMNFFDNTGYGRITEQYILEINSMIASVRNSLPNTIQKGIENILDNENISLMQRMYT
jgi:hypothetical protein